MHLDFLACYMLGAKVHVEIDFNRKRVIEPSGRFRRNDRTAPRIATRYKFSIRARRQGHAIWANDQSKLMVLVVRPSRTGAFHVVGRVGATAGRAWRESDGNRQGEGKPIHENLLKRISSIVHSYQYNPAALNTGLTRLKIHLDNLNMNGSHCYQYIITRHN